MPRQIGLERLTVAKITKDDETGTIYAVPVKLERSIKAKISPKTSSEKLYSDDSVEDILNNFDSCDVEIEVNQLTIASRALLQGSKVVDGMLIENKDDLAPELALGFRSKKSNGKYRYVWLLKGKFEHTEDEYETIGEKPTPKTNSLKGSFYGRNDGNWRLMEDEDSEGANMERLANWFVSVPEIPKENEENPDDNGNVENPDEPENPDIPDTPVDPENPDDTGNTENPDDTGNTEGTDEGGENTETGGNPEEDEGTPGDDTDLV